MAAQNLRTPGPTPLPPAVRQALARDMIAHRGPEFATILRECIDGLKWAFQTQHDVVILTTSGTGGLESLVANTLSPGQRLLVASMGYFGERMGKIARAFGIDVVQIDFEPGQATLRIQDRGSGFVLPRDPAGLAREGHYGLANMQERARKVSGDLRMTSAPGQGTCVELVVSAGEELER